MNTKEKFFKEIKSSQTIDTLISNFMSIKQAIGNGVGAGKIFESVFVHEINKNFDLNAIHMNLSNNSFIWDIIIHEKTISEKAELELIQIIKENGKLEINLLEEKINKTLGTNWIAISLKTYKENDCQITTNYTLRTYLEDKIGDNSTSDKAVVQDFFNLLNKYDDEKYIIIALNTYEKTNKYTFRHLKIDKFERIEFKQNRSHSQYNLILDDKPYIKILYGKNQANPYQRGAWVYGKKAINYFELILDSKWTDNDFFNTAILDNL